MAGFGPLEALIGTFGKGVAGLDPHETLIGTFGEGVTDFDLLEAAICTLCVGVAVSIPQEVAVTSMTRGDEAETCEGKVWSGHPLLACTGLAGPAKLTGTGSSLKRSAKNENEVSKQPLPG